MFLSCKEAILIPRGVDGVAGRNEAVEDGANVRGVAVEGAEVVNVTEAWWFASLTISLSLSLSLAD
jgi:hypothetical protein